MGLGLCLGQGQGLCLCLFICHHRYVCGLCTSICGVCVLSSVGQFRVQFKGHKDAGKSEAERAQEQVSQKHFQKC